jgi:glycosyltransferase involved in cell wall biosynthesis
MKIWLIKEGEPLPCDKDPRLMRMGLLAEELVSMGHQVLWWTSTFEHGRKRVRFKKTTEINMFQNGKLILLNSPVKYYKNTSIKRIIYHYLLGKAFIKKAYEYEVPDIIFCAYPTVDFAKQAVLYGKKNKVKVILDIRDLWPDIFSRAIPVQLKFLEKILLKPFDIRSNKVIRDADCLTAIIPSHLKWALKKANRERNKNDKSIYIGYKETVISKKQNELALSYWKEKGVTINTWNICFFGTMSAMTMDMSTVINGIKKLVKRYGNIRLVLGGEGDALENYKKEAKGCEEIIFPGWLNKVQIQSLMDLSRIGIYPFHNLPDFKNSITNKMIEYWSAGLPVLSSITGYSKEYINKYRIGRIYREGNVDSLFNNVEWFYENRQIMKIMKENAKTRYLADFKSEIVNQKFIQLMNSMIDQKMCGQ